MSKISKTLINKLKKQAKQQSKISERTLTQIQDEIARNYGYLNWRTFISYQGRGAVTIAEVEDWFRSNFEAAANLSRANIFVEEPHEIFDIFQEHFDFALDYDDGGRMVELAINLAEEDAWSYSTGNTLEEMS